MSNIFNIYLNINETNSNTQNIHIYLNMDSLKNNNQTQEENIINCNENNDVNNNNGAWSNLLFFLLYFSLCSIVSASNHFHESTLFNRNSTGFVHFIDIDDEEDDDEEDDDKAELLSLSVPVINDCCS